MSKILRFFILIFLYNNIYSFNSLSDAIKFSKLNPEYVPADNKDTSNPDYSSFFRKKYKKKVWSDVLFKDILHSLIKSRVERGYFGKFIQKISPTGSHIFIWGSLHGAFHSLVRCLSYLEKNGFINNNLEITIPNCYFVFNGNVVDGSPYVLETLTLLMSLMKKNEDRVVYIKGDLENSSNWQNFGLNQELKIKFLNSFKDIIIDTTLIANDINKFFDTLPLALYVDGINPFDGLLRVSYFSGRDDIIKESYCAETLSSLFLDKFDMAKLNPPERYPVPPIRAIIRHQDYKMSFRNFLGLTTLEPDIYSTTWKIFSSPVSIYQDSHNFYYDSFVLVKTGFNLVDSSISLFSKDIRENFDFQIKSYNLITCQEINKIELKKPDIKFDITKDQKEELEKKLSSIKNIIEKINFDVYKLKVNIEKAF